MLLNAAFLSRTSPTHAHYRARNLNISLCARGYFPVYVFISVSCTQLLSFQVLYFTGWHAGVCLIKSETMIIHITNPRIVYIFAWCRFVDSVTIALKLRNSPFCGLPSFLWLCVCMEEDDVNITLVLLRLLTEIWTQLMVKCSIIYMIYFYLLIQFILECDLTIL